MLFTVSLQIRLNSIMLHKDVIGFCVVARSPPQPALQEYRAHYKAVTHEPFLS